MMKDTFILPLEDFRIIFEGFKVVCQEYTGAPEVDEIYLPIYDKYIKHYNSLLKEENENG